MSDVGSRRGFLVLRLLDVTEEGLVVLEAPRLAHRVGETALRAGAHVRLRRRLGMNGTLVVALRLPTPVDRGADRLRYLCPAPRRRSQP
jgi:hypothetical protein